MRAYLCAVGYETGSSVGAILNELSDDLPFCIKTTDYNARTICSTQL